MEIDNFDVARGTSPRSIPIIKPQNYFHLCSLHAASDLCMCMGQVKWMTKTSQSVPIMVTHDCLHTPPWASLRTVLHDQWRLNLNVIQQCMPGCHFLTATSPLDLVPGCTGSLAGTCLQIIPLLVNYDPIYVNHYPK